MDPPSEASPRSTVPSTTTTLMPWTSSSSGPLVSPPTHAATSTNEAATPRPLYTSPACEATPKWLSSWWRVELIRTGWTGMATPACTLPVEGTLLNCCTGCWGNWSWLHGKMRQTRYNTPSIYHVPVHVHCIYVCIILLFYIVCKLDVFTCSFSRFKTCTIM